MLFTIEKYVIRSGSRFLRRFSSTIDTRTNDAQKEVLQFNDNFTSIHQEGKKSLKIAILGAPNAGKSTLVNQLIKRSVCATSSKVHTTQTKADAIYTEGNTQLVFMDTPGTVSLDEYKRYKLTTNFTKDPKVSLKIADVIGIVQDTENVFTRHKINPNILKLIEDTKNEIPMILILNKVDKLKKKEILLHLVKNLTNKEKDSPDFFDIFMVSALTGDGVDDLRTYMLDLAKPREWHYEKHIYSDHTCEDIVQQMVRAKLMDNLPKELPYILKVKVEHFDITPDDSIRAVVSITCPNKRIQSLMSKGKRIKNIAVTTQQELRHAFRTIVNLKLQVQ